MGADERFRLAPLTPDRLALSSGAEVSVVSFYCPDTGLQACDRRTGGGPFANFWPLPTPMHIAHNRASGTFSNSEAAYQSLKWWQDAPTRRKFEACTAAGLKGGGDAFLLKRRCERAAELSSFAKADMDGLGRLGAMLLVLRAKWRLPVRVKSALAALLSFSF